MDASVKVEAELRKRFEEREDIIGLRIKERGSFQSGNYLLSANLSCKIKSLWEEYFAEYLKNVEKDVRQMTFEKAGVPESDMPLINELLVTMFMAAEIIDGAVVDLNDVLHRTDRELSFEMYDDFRGFSKSIKEKLDFFNKNTSYNKDLFWIDKCEDMYALIRNKARSIIRKRSSDGWGRNFEVYNPEGKK